MGSVVNSTSSSVLCNWVRDARTRTLELIEDLDDEQLMGPRLATVNPLIWEIGHAAWFQEKWVLQHVGGQEPIRSDGAIYDSIGIEHDIRWDLPLPSRDATLQYVGEVRDRVVDLLQRGPLSDELVYFVKYSVFHEDMHSEAFTYTRQTLGYPVPKFSGSWMSEPVRPSDQLYDQANSPPFNLGDVEISGLEFMLGAVENSSLVFDNEKWAHAVQVQPFAMARTCVTQAEFAAFVEDDGYRRDELWSVEGRQWREGNGVEHPLYWKQSNHRWLRRDFDQWVPLEPKRAMIHVNWFEADAFCRWANRRLPSELEWEVAAAASIVTVSNSAKRIFPWGDDGPTPTRANLDWRAMGTIAATSLPDGDSEFGCRQMIGNVWEWTASDFQPYPGFVADAYNEYSQTSFGKSKVLRGGCWATRSRLVRNTYRNYYCPDRRDVWAGFRTCALR